MFIFWWHIPLTYRYIDHLSTKPYPTILEPPVPLGSTGKFGLLVKEWSLVKDQTKFGFGPAGIMAITMIITIVILVIIMMITIVILSIREHLTVIALVSGSEFLNRG